VPVLGTAGEWRKHRTETGREGRAVETGGRTLKEGMRKGRRGAERSASGGGRRGGSSRRRRGGRLARRSERRRRRRDHGEKERRNKTKAWGRGREVRVREGTEGGGVVERRGASDREPSEEERRRTLLEAGNLAPPPAAPVGECESSASDSGSETAREGEGESVRRTCSTTRPAGTARSNPGREERWP
jgi:hypothetical protein